MKHVLSKIFSPLLNIFENTSDEFQLTPTNRKVAIFAGVAFIVVAILIPIIASTHPWTAFLFPVLVFGTVGCVGLIVGCLGSDHAVAKLMGNRRK